VPDGESPDRPDSAAPFSLVFDNIVRSSIHVISFTQPIV
jgi:hypothetical protein